ncbi:hypothetical protein GQ44DRAFT_776099 [Phaeosphaeriaceae sp. PMI808]|nr:hypothetical protein GQ44DRAFT_776099 [Phaeosphaeriaceae sp. PMI808]
MPLIASIFPGQYQKLITCPWQVQQDSQFNDEEIHEAVRKVFDQEDTYNAYVFCFFIDGLDEYEETLQNDYKVLVRTLKEWVHISGGGVKICVSSREYNVFENAFPSEKRLRLQDLTRLDMEQYARDMLQDLKNEEQKSRLVSEISSRSDGIFFWVALVVKAFREYIEDDQDFGTFEAIPESLPDELELLFEHLLATVRKPALKRAYQIFALMDYIKKHYGERMFLLPCIFLEDYDKNRRFSMELVF